MTSTKEQLQALRDEYYAVLIIMQNHYFSRADVNEILARGRLFIKQTDEVLQLHK